MDQVPRMLHFNNVGTIGKNHMFAVHRELPGILGAKGAWEF